MTERRQPTKVDIDDTQDRMGEVHPLDFDQERDARSGRAGDERPASEIEDMFDAERVREAGMTGGEMPDGHVTRDDLAPETLLEADGSRSPDERGQGPAADRDLRIEREGDLGGGQGLDEAEQARHDPLDGRPWDGDAQSDLGGGDALLAPTDEGRVLDEDMEGEAPLDSGHDRSPRNRE